jgi:hypothetical protein
MNKRLPPPATASASERAYGRDDPLYDGHDERAKTALIPLNRDLGVAFIVDELICEGYVGRALDAHIWRRPKGETDGLSKHIRE